MCSDTIQDHCLRYLFFSISFLDLHLFVLCFIFFLLLMNTHTYVINLHLSGEVPSVVTTGVGFPGLKQLALRGRVSRFEQTFQDRFWSHCVARVPKALRWAAPPTCRHPEGGFPQGRKCRRVVASGVIVKHLLDKHFRFPSVAIIFQIGII